MIVLLSSVLTALATAQDVPIITKYKGRIYTDPIPSPDANVKEAAFEKETVITNQTQYNLFVSRLPLVEPLNTKGDDHLNDDPLLKKPIVNFSNNMVIAVTRDNMYLPPEITHAVISNDTLIVQYTEEELGEVANYQQEGGLGTYCVAVIPKSDKKIIFKVTTTKATQPKPEGDGLKPAP